jgi:hypothetical protein
MAKHVLGPASTFTVNGTDLSQYVTNVSVEDSADEVDVTGFSQTYREFTPGLKDSTITATFLADFEAGSGPDAILAPLYYNNTAGTVKVKPQTSGTVVFTQVSKIYSYPPVNGGVGDANTFDTTFRNSGTAGLTRGTA